MEKYTFAHRTRIDVQWKIFEYILPFNFHETDRECIGNRTPKWQIHKKKLKQSSKTFRDCSTLYPYKYIYQKLKKKNSSYFRHTLIESQSTEAILVASTLADVLLTVGLIIITGWRWAQWSNGTRLTLMWTRKTFSAKTMTACCTRALSVLICLRLVTIDDGGIAPVFTRWMV